MKSSKVLTAIVCSILVLSSLASFASTPKKSNLQSLLSQVPSLHAKVLQLAMTAYQHAHQQGLDKQGILTVIDYSLPSTKKRFWVIDVNHNKVLYSTLTAHGSGSGANMATRFSNTRGTRESSIGLYKAGSTYFGHRGLSLRLIGLEKGFNDHALKRDVVIHGAWYVSKAFAKAHGRLGRSWGCPALSLAVYKPIIKKIKNGSLIFAYYPSKTWLAQSHYLH